MQDQTTAPPRCQGDEECTSGSRNRYFLGKRLTPPAFQSEQDYHVERRRLLNRSIHGWGVVYGLPITPAQSDDCQPVSGLAVGPGLALDRAGRELLLTQSKNLSWAEVWKFDSQNQPTPNDARCDDRDEDARCWLLAAHYAERNVGRVEIKDDCHCDRVEWDQICEEVFFSLRLIDCDECCAPHDCELCCGCVGECELPLRPHNRGPHRCLCRHLTALRVGPEIDSLCRVRDGLKVDLNNGVALACVSLKADECGGWEFDRVIDACGPRRLVKRNDLLFDLIRGCDLTVIDSISWSDWHRSTTPVSADDFAAKFTTEKDPLPRLVTQFWLRFSRPVQRPTVRLDCFTMTVVGAEEDTGWGEVVRVPITGLDLTSQSGDPQDTARAVSLIVDGEWFIDELKSKRSIFRNEASLVEIEVRGDFILDCNGQAVDANAVGLRAAPSGNGTPGGTFMSTFTVASREAERSSKPA